HRLHNHGGPVSQHLGDALHDLGGVVASADDGVPAQFGGVGQHQVKGFGTSFFAEVGQQRNVAAQNRLQPGANGSEDGARANHNAAHHSQATNHAKSIQFKLRGHHVVGDHPAGCCVADAHGVRPLFSVS